MRICFHHDAVSTCLNAQLGRGGGQPGAPCRTRQQQRIGPATKAGVKLRSRHHSPRQRPQAGALRVPVGVHQRAALLAAAAEDEGARCRFPPATPSHTGNENIDVSNQSRGFVQ